MELFSLKNKVAIVTGSGGLLGQQHCIALAQAGANVVVCDTQKEVCEKVANQLPTQSLPLAFDITQPQALQEAKDEILSRFGHIDILVNNAAINDRFEDPALAAQNSMFENYPLEMFKASLEVNVTGMFLCCQVFGTPMAKQGKGSIINVASTYGMVGPDQNIYINDNGVQTFYKSAAYPVTKGAVLNFTRFLASYWGKNGVRVNSLSPGGVQNGQEDFFVKNYSAKTVLGRMSQPTEYQGAIVFLASDASGYMSGANLVVDGGWTAI